MSLEWFEANFNSGIEKETQKTYIQLEKFF